MTQHKFSLVTAQGEVFAIGGKLSQIAIAVGGDRIWNIREVNVSGAIKYKVDCSVDAPHNNIDVPFKTALFAEIASGSTGELNILVE